MPIQIHRRLSTAAPPLRFASYCVFATRTRRSAHILRSQAGAVEAITVDLQSRRNRSGQRFPSDPDRSSWRSCRGLDPSFLEPYIYRTRAVHLRHLFLVPPAWTRWLSATPDLGQLKTPTILEGNPARVTGSRLGHHPAGVSTRQAGAAETRAANRPFPSSTTGRPSNIARESSGPLKSRLYSSLRHRQDVGTRRAALVKPLWRDHNIRVTKIGTMSRL